MLSLSGEKLQVYNDFEAIFNRDVAEKAMKCLDIMVGDAPSVHVFDCVAVATLMMKSALDQLLNTVFEGDQNRCSGDLKNLGYYTEQVMASLCLRYQEKKTEEPSSLILQ
jgi:hypothetical protein